MKMSVDLRGSDNAVVEIMVDRGNEEEEGGEVKDGEEISSTSRQESDGSSLDLRNYLRNDILETVLCKHQERFVEEDFSFFESDVCYNTTVQYSSTKYYRYCSRIELFL